MDDCALLSNVGGTTSHNDTEAKRSGSQTIVLSMSPEKEEEKKNEKKKEKKKRSGPTVLAAQRKVPPWRNDLRDGAINTAL